MMDCTVFDYVVKEIRETNFPGYPKLHVVGPSGIVSIRNNTKFTYTDRISACRDILQELKNCQGQVRKDIPQEIDRQREKVIATLCTSSRERLLVIDGEKP